MTTGFRALSRTPRATAAGRRVADPKSEGFPEFDPEQTGRLLVIGFLVAVLGWGLWSNTFRSAPTKRPSSFALGNIFGQQVLDRISRSPSASTEFIAQADQATDEDGVRFPNR